MQVPSTTVLWVSAHSPLSYPVFVSDHDSGLHATLVCLAMPTSTCQWMPYSRIAQAKPSYQLSDLWWLLWINRCWCDLVSGRVKGDCRGAGVETPVMIEVGGSDGRSGQLTPDSLRIENSDWGKRRGMQKRGGNQTDVQKHLGAGRELLDFDGCDWVGKRRKDIQAHVYFWLHTFHPIKKRLRKKTDLGDA